MKAIADRIVTRWADEDLGSLLDYVYLETEPMLIAAYGDDLIFSSVVSERRRILLDDIELSEDEINVIRDLQKKYQALSVEERVLPYDPELAKVLKGLEGESNTQNLHGTVGLSREESEFGWEGRE